ncbi:hypothetical protein Asi02nite_25170 [Asanoa siamensis]|uniref:TetR family transcriptional regulator n=2 Tax=Asanoa siamensis TaxID=926357 RepID=A0ABQ4CNZ0_9ACTN|nr:hypothetical protein Asi02nite_25170 [Asanoa siamensis]
MHGAGGGLPHPREQVALDAEIDAGLTRLVAGAVRAIGDRVARGQSPAAVVADVVATMFGGLADRSTVDRIVALALRIVEETAAGRQGAQPTP